LLVDGYGGHRLNWGCDKRGWLDSRGFSSFF